MHHLNSQTMAAKNSKFPHDPFFTSYDHDRSIQVGPAESNFQSIILCVAILILFCVAKPFGSLILCSLTQKMLQVSLFFLDRYSSDLLLILIVMFFSYSSLSNRSEPTTHLRQLVSIKK